MPENRMRSYASKIIQKGMKRLMIENRGLFRELKWIRTLAYILRVFMRKKHTLTHRIEFCLHDKRDLGFMKGA